MKKILAINGSYRDDGITDQAVELLSQALKPLNAELEVIPLREYPIEFCLNCRECTQRPGEAPGKCVHGDGMGALIEKIEQADGFVLASPTNFGSVTAIFKRFMERLVVYTHWPWDANAPKYRKQQATKKAILVSSSAAPSFLGRFFFDSLKQLKSTSKVIGAKPVGTLFTGLISKEPHPSLPQKTEKQIKKLAKELI